MSSPLEHGDARRESYAGLAALESGGAGGETVLLVPGFTGSKEDFAPVLDPIAADGRHAVAIDLPGQFESPPLPSGSSYLPESLGRVVLDVAAALGPRVHLVGHSYGGLVSRAAVIAAPDAFASLTLLSSGPAEIGGDRRFLIDHLEPVLAEGGVAGVYAAAQAVSPEDGRTPELAAFYEKRFLAQSAEMLSGMAQGLRTEPDRVAELAGTGVSLLVVHGEDDDAWPPDVQREMAGRLGARYEVVAGAAHSAAIENPAALIEVLRDFWS